MPRHASGHLVLLAAVAWSGLAASHAWELREDGYHVRPGEHIQPALDQAAANKTNKTVLVHPGTYRPHSARQALVWFNKRHDGITLKAAGRVVLTASNPEISKPSTPGHPAVVNHIVYFGDGISPRTTLQGFTLTGANGFVTQEGTAVMEPDETLPKGLFFYNDGGAIKIFGRSYPTIVQVECIDNYSSPCAGGVSIEHRGFVTNFVTIVDSVFRNNRAQVTGAAIDLLEGSAAKVVNCLFTGNRSNTGADIISTQNGQEPFTNNGVITVFTESRIWLERCTLVNNRNGLDDMEGRSLIKDCIFWNNFTRGKAPQEMPFDLDVQTGTRIEGCFLNGNLPNPYNGPYQVNVRTNAPPPDFDASFVPKAPEYNAAGYRPPR